MNISEESGCYCGTGAIVGRPNVGKSTLFNGMLGQKVSITSRKAQTTRHRIMGILTEDDAQFVFLDTPGFQTRHTQALNRTLNRTARAALADIDFALFIVEAGRWGPQDKQVLELLDACDYPVIAVVNKRDCVTDPVVLCEYLELLSQQRNFHEIVPVSAKRPEDIAYLLKVLRKYLPQGPFIYGKEELTDRSERFLASEILREKIFRWTGEELPYGATVVIEKFEEVGALRRIFAGILVNSSSHKAMLIGKKGTKLKQINTDARLDMEQLFGGPVYLEVWVKCKSGWADNETALQAYGYAD